MKIKKSKKKKINFKILFAVIIVVLIISVVLGILILFRREPEIEGISAFEGYQVAEQVAKEWNTSVYLNRIDSSGELNGKGMCTQWTYKFVIENNMTHFIEIKIDNDLNHSYSIGEHPRRTFPDEWGNNSNGEVYNTSFFWNLTEGRRISNWVLDSDDAVRVCRDSGEINDQIESFPGKRLSHMFLWDLRNTPGTCSWSLDWESNLFENGMSVRIDAQTGKILNNYEYDGILPFL